MSTVNWLRGSWATAPTGWTLVILPEGYTQEELGKGLFDDDVRELLATLFRTAPFSHQDMQWLINVAMVRIPSANTGNTIKLSDAAPRTSPFGTAFGALYGRDYYTDPATGKKAQIKRSLYGDDDKVTTLVHEELGLKAASGILVIVNNTELDGGSGGRVGWFSKTGNWPRTAVHELGHQAFGLDDEYEYQVSRTDPPRSFPGDEPAAVNVSKESSVAMLKWRALLTVPPVLVPTTVTSATCIRNHPTRTPLQPGDPPVPAGAVGAFEGAARYSCRVFRPSRTCLMREHDAPFCRVCETTIRADVGHYLLSQGAHFLARNGEWTYVQPYTQGQEARLLAYHSGTGRYAVSRSGSYFQPYRRADGTPPLVSAQPDIGAGAIDTGWTTLLPFTLNGTRHYLGHALSTGRWGTYELAAAGNRLTKVGDAPSGTALTHVLPAPLPGPPHCVGYNTLTGEATLFAVDAGGGAPTPLRTMQWEPGHTALVTVPAGNEVFVLAYRIITGEVVIRRVTTAGSTRTFVSPPFFWRVEHTHLALAEIHGRPYVLRYSALTGEATLHHFRKDGTGLDVVCGLRPAPGPGGLITLGVGAMIMGRVTIPSGTSGTSEEIFFYDSTSQTIRLYGVRPSR